MSVIITERAAKEVQRVVSEQNMPAETVLRIGVAGGGCSGFQYSLGFDTKIDEAADHVTSQHGIQVAVDKRAWKNAVSPSKTRTPSNRADAGAVSLHK